MRQKAVVWCFCGGDADVTPTASEWDFKATCRVCQKSHQISWATKDPPPTFTAPEGQQQELF